MPDQDELSIDTSMDTHSHRSGTLESLLLRRCAEVTQQTVAEAIGLDRAGVPRIFSGERGIGVSKLEAFLQSLGLAVIECSSDTVTLPRDHYEALRLLAKRGI